jgi:hypothetical protein
MRSRLAPEISIHWSGTARDESPSPKIPKIPKQYSSNIGPPSDVSWLTTAPVTRVTSTINHSNWSFLNQLRYLGGLTLRHRGRSLWGLPRLIYEVNIQGQYLINSGRPFRPLVSHILRQRSKFCNQATTKYQEDCWFIFPLQVNQFQRHISCMLVSHLILKCFKVYTVGTPSKRFGGLCSQMLKRNRNSNYIRDSFGRYMACWKFNHLQFIDFFPHKTSV